MRLQIVEEIANEIADISEAICKQNDEDEIGISDIRLAAREVLSKYNVTLLSENRGDYIVLYPSDRGEPYGT